jgi:hypothetical protein
MCGGGSNKNDEFLFYFNKKLKHVLQYKRNYQIDEAGSIALSKEVSKKPSGLISRIPSYWCQMLTCCAFTQNRIPDDTLYETLPRPIRTTSKGAEVEGRTV